jgi:hypothetical protein
MRATYDAVRYVRLHDVDDGSNLEAVQEVLYDEDSWLQRDHF